MKIYKLSFLCYIPVISVLLFPCMSCNEAPASAKASQLPKPGVANIAFKSTDGGQTWQDISKGLPENLQKDSIKVNSFFVNDNGLFFRVGNGLYHNTTSATAPFWTKEIFHGEDSSMAPGKAGLPAYNYWGVNLKKANGKNVWSPLFEFYFQQPVLRSVFETAGGTVFIGTQKGFFKTDDNGDNWKQVHAGSLVGHLAEADSVLLAISGRKIIRSTDNGENWAPVISEDSVAWDVKPMKGGFVATTSTSEKSTRRLSTSYDGGKTWQSIHSSLQDKAVIDSIGRNWDNRPVWKTYMTSIIQVDENLFCTHRGGIFKSSDKGKTWSLLLPSVEDRGFNLFVLDKVIYAIIPSKNGC